MRERRQPGSRSDREARRALLQDALRDLAGADDPDRAAHEVMRALDVYVEEETAARAVAPREPPVTDYDRREPSEIRWATWLVLGGAVVATGVVAVALAGGWPAALAVVAIWVFALVVVTST